MGLNHSHSKGKDRNLMISIWLKILITAAQIVGGLISGSLALLSDALHNFSDVVTLIVSYVASKLSRQKASFHRTFGYKRAEILAAFINALTLVVVAILLIVAAVQRFHKPQPISSSLVIWLALIAILANGISVLLLKKDAKNNLNMRSAYVHLFTDMMASLAVLIGGLLMTFYQWYWVDSVLTLLIALYLIWAGFDLLIKSSKILMLFTPDHIDIKNVVRAVHQITKVNRLHHVHIWGLNDEELHLEAHLEFKEDITLSEFDTILQKIEILLHDQFEINHVNIQPEFNKIDPKEIIVQD